MSKLSMVAVVGIVALLLLFATSAYAQEMVTLTVNSPYGVPDPPIGVNTYAKGATIPISVASPVAGGPGIQYSCVGWKAKGDPGNLPAVGFTNSYTIPQLMKSAVLTWRWKVQYLLTLNVEPVAHCVPGYIDFYCANHPEEPSGTYPPSQATWWTSGRVAQLTAVAHQGYDFTYWSGGSGAIRSEPTKNPTVQKMRRPETITAVFVTEPRAFSVASAQGEPAPAVGTYTPYYDETINANCGPNPYPAGEGMQYVCTGHLGTGDVTDGPETSISFIIHHDSSVTWTWQLQYYFDVISQCGAPAGEGWYDEGATVSSCACSPLPALEPTTNALTYGSPISPYNWDSNCGFRFTANNNIFVTKVVTNRGNGTVPVTIWTDAGTLLRRVDVPNCAAGVWTEADVVPPLELTAGQTYRIATYWNGNPTYYSVSAFPPYVTSPDITVEASCSGTGFTFPASTASVYYVGGLCNFKYTQSRYRCTEYTGTGSCPSGTGTSVTFTIDTPSSIIWNWITQHPLSVSINPAGYGTVGASPTSVDGFYDIGTVVTLTASPTGIYCLDSWSGDLTGTENPKDITIDCAKNVTANFARPRLIVSNPRRFDTPVPAVGTYTYNRGTSITCYMTNSPVLMSSSRFTEEFESGDISGWTTGSPAWSATADDKHSGSYSAVSGSVSYGQTSYIQRTFTVGSGGATLTFWWKAASSSSSNRLRFYIDSIQQTYIYNNAWLQGTYSLSAGTRTLKWEYYCESNTSTGTGWIDDIEVTDVPVPDPNTEFYCVGYTGTGSCPSGTGMSVTFTIETHSSITWNWQGKFKLFTSVAPVSTGTVTVSPVQTWHDEGSSVTLEAIPIAGYAFCNWSGDQTGSINPVTITMTKTKTITANFKHAVTVASLYGEPSPPVGVSYYDHNASVTLSCGLTPYPGPPGTRYVNTGWSGGSGSIPALGDASIFSFTITTNSTITWTWQVQTNWYQLFTAVNPLGKGSITPASNSWHQGGTVVSCLATPVALWGFLEWSGDLTGTQNPKNLLIDGNKSITANFFQPTLTVYNPTGLGTTKPLVGTHTCEYDKSVTCSAVWPAYEMMSGTFTEGWESGSMSDWWSTGGDANWFISTRDKKSGTYSAESGDISDAPGVGQYTETWLERVFVIGEGGGSIEFWWKVSSETNWDWLEFYIDGELQTGRISGSIDWTQKSYVLSAGSHTVRWRYVKDFSVSSGWDCGLVDNIVVMNTTTPDINYVCAGYTGTGSCPSGTMSSVTFTITSHSTITWHWKPCYRLDVSVDPAGAGKVSADHSILGSYYVQDSVISLLAEANPGYTFAFWSGDLTGTENPNSLAMDGPKSVTAHFCGPNLPSNFSGAANSTSAITWSWTSNNNDWQSIAAGVLRALASTLTSFQATYGDLPPSETCPRTGSGDDRLLFETVDDLPDMPDDQDCPTIDASAANTYTISYVRVSSSSFTCTADTNLSILKDFYIDETSVLREEMSTGDGAQADAGSAFSPDNVWWEVQNSAHLSLTTVYPNITSWQEIGLAENTQYTRHVHVVNCGVYSAPSNGASCYTLVHDATLGDFSVALVNQTATITISTGTNQRRYPIDISANYARCQMLLLGSQMGVYAEIGGQAGLITKIRFQRAVGSTDTVNNARIHMVQSTNLELLSWEDTASHIQVYTGNLSIPADAADTWFEIPLATPCYYDGTRNFIISFRHQDGSKETSYTTWKNQTVFPGAPWASRRCVAGASDTVNPPAVTVVDDRPNIQLVFKWGDVTITVTPPPNSTAGLTGVRIERDANSAFLAPTVIRDYAPVYSKTEVRVGGPWHYRIRFRNGDGVPSGHSPGVSITVP